MPFRRRSSRQANEDVTLREVETRGTERVPSSPVSEIDKARLDQLRRRPVTIYLVDDCTPETIGVFTSFESAIEFADVEQAARIRVGVLDSREWAEVKWERNQVTGQWEPYR